MNAIELFHETAARQPDALALVGGRAGREARVRFGELDSRARRIAALMRARGLQPGDGVAVLVPMSIELYAVMAGLLHAGLVPVFAEPSAWRRALGHGVPGIRLAAFVGVPAACALRLVVPALRKIPRAFVAGRCFPGAVPLRAAARMAPSAHCAARLDVDTAIVTFTSGTTGSPKGVLRSHGLLLATHRILCRHLELAPGALQVAVLPIFVFANLAAGAPSLIPDADLARPGAIDARRLLAQMARWQPSGLVASPSLAGRLAGAPQGAPGLASLRRVLIGGAPVFPGLLDRFGRAAPAARTSAIYGASEAEPIAVMDREAVSADDRAAMRAGGGLLAGSPIPEIALRIVRAEVPAPSTRLSGAGLDAITVEPGHVGEIIVAGENVSPGYLGGLADRDTKLEAGGMRWHRTGDAGRLDAQGRLWLYGPVSAAVDGPGGRRYPLAVDAALSEHPDVVRATLVREGTRAVLVIEARARLSVAQAAAIAASVPWAGADAVVLVERMPLDRRHAAKIDHPALRALLEDRRWLLRTPVQRAPC